MCPVDMQYQCAISVIVPMYNVQQYIANCIESILRESFSNFELLLIDDSSTDATLDVCKEYLDDNRIHVVSIKKQGVSAARNYGTQIAKGEWITFVDADDICYNR